MTTPERDLLARLLHDRGCMAGAECRDSPTTWVVYYAQADELLSALDLPGRDERVRREERQKVTEERTYPNVVVDGEEWEHSDRLGPGCWHPVKRPGQCRSWQGLIQEAEFRATVRAAQNITEEQSND